MQTLAQIKSVALKKLQSARLEFKILTILTIDLTEELENLVTTFAARKPSA